MKTKQVKTKQKGTFIDKLLSTKTGRKLFYRESLVLEVTESICWALKDSKTSYSKLAKALRISKYEIRKLLSGQRKISLDMASDMLVAMGYKLTTLPIRLTKDTCRYRPVHPFLEQE